MIFVCQERNDIHPWSFTFILSYFWTTLQKKPSQNFPKWRRYLWLLRKTRFFSGFHEATLLRSAISRNMNLWSAKTILWTFVMFSGTTADFGWLERSASSAFVPLRLNSTYQSMIVDFPGAEFQYDFFPLKSNVWSMLETLFYPLFWKWQKLLHHNLCNFWTKRKIVMKFWHLTFAGWYYPEVIWIWQQWCHL